MKVLNLRGINDIRLEEREIPEIKDNEVLLKVKACGICSSDEDRIFKTGTYHFPTVPGHEFAGQVVKTGAGVEKSILGARASVFPLLPCFNCDSCKQKRFATCSNYKYFGSRNDGGFSEYIAVPEWNLNILDDSVSYEVAALSEPAAVANHAVMCSGLKEGDTVAVIGTGAIGILIAGLSKLHGAIPLILGRRESSISMVKDFNIEAIKIQDINEADKKQSFDVVFEAATK